ncbi:MAG: DUF2520 domain-containing protein [Chloroflexi bacterium]|nr:DUF2520 domain-containing protein [Chloroflexota bacterium]
MIAIGIIGAGTVGKALAWRLTRAALPAAPGQPEMPWRVVAVASRSRTSAQQLAARVPGCQVVDSPQEVADRADLVFITTPDDVVPSIAEDVAWQVGQWVVHCSGADSVQNLDPARRAGALVGGFHPLYTFASAERALEDLAGATFALEGEGPLLEALKRIAEALGGRWIVLRPEDKVLYHAAAVLACNYLVTLTKLATDLWQQFGVEREAAVAALIPLLRGTVNNLAEVGLPAALTGPIARGDTGTVRKHLLALMERAPAVLTMYRELGLQTLPVALEKGRIDTRQATELLALWEGREVPTTT